MCGIFGHIGKIAERQANACILSLSHRGPDGQGLVTLDGVTLGHRRLAILDLTDKGRQPMSYANGRYWITYNGEIYNFLEIRTELETKGHIFKSDSDTEVILAAYVEWSEQCLNKFNGMWAFAIYDDREKTLFLSRDRFGKKPLFYAFLNGRFAFASEMKGLFPLLSEVRVTKDFGWMLQNIFRYESSGKCLVEGIERFPAGHYGLFRDGKLELFRYWNTLDHVSDVPRPYQDQVDQFKTLFIDACRIRMRSDVPIGTALSGGLDSSAVIATMAHIGSTQTGGRINNDWQHAFCATFPGTPLDESYYAKKVVNHLGIRANFLFIDPLKDIHLLEDFFYKFEELYITSPIPMMQTYRAVKRAGISVTLDGHGADELFSGYGDSLFEAFMDCGLNLRVIRDIADTYRNLCPEAPGQLRGASSRTHLLLRYLPVKYVRKILRMPFEHSQDEGHPNFQKLDHFNRHLYIMSHETILPALLRNYDRYSMASGVEIRMPFMDHRLVAYSFSLPWSSKLRDGYTKKIVRDAVGSFLPSEVATRKTKIGFSSPVINWMKNEMKDYFSDTIHSQEFRDCALIDAPAVKASIEIIMAKDNVTFTEGEKAWTGFMPFLWEKALIRRSYTWK